MNTRFALIVLCFSLAGCQSGNGPLGVPDSHPALGGDLERVDAHVQSADNLVVAAKPSADSRGQGLLDAAHQELGAATKDNGDAKKALAKSTSERDQLEKLYRDEHEARLRVEAGWGYRLQVFVARLTWLIVGIFAAHYVFLFAGLFVPGLWGGVLTKLGTFVNPLGWAQALRDHLAARTFSATE